MVNRRFMNRVDSLPPRSLGNRSSVSTVEAASRPALAVDIMAARAAAMTRPRIPSGRVALTMAAKALLTLSRSGSSTWAAIPIRAQARP
ncbi:hypothetical protein D3C76_1756800 [compost metagenome]